MIRTIIKRNLYVNNLIARKHAGRHSALDTCVNSGDIFLRNSAADDCVDKFIALAGLVRLNLELDVTVLTFTARLTSVFGVNICGLGNCFLISNLRSTDVCLDLKFTQKSVNDNFKVKLAHSGDNRLSCFLIGISLEGRVFLGKL